MMDPSKIGKLRYIDISRRLTDDKLGLRAAPTQLEGGCEAQRVLIEAIVWKTKHFSKQSSIDSCSSALIQTPRKRLRFIGRSPKEPYLLFAVSDAR